MAKNKNDINPDITPEPIPEQAAPDTFPVRFFRPFLGAFNSFEIKAKPDDVIEVNGNIWLWLKQFDVAVKC